MLRLSLSVAVLLTAGSLASCATGAPGSASGVTIETVGNRADLISGGDALLRVTLPAGTSEPSLSVNGRWSETALKRAPDGKSYLALVANLKDGANTVQVLAGDRRASLDITNHANGGPIFSGPQLQPWPCKPGAVNAQCDRPTTFSWHYMPAAGGEFKPYARNAPPGDVARVTVNGVEMPYIVRMETFTQNRSGVSVAALYDPAKLWDAFQPQKQWNKGVLVLQGAGCGTGYGEQEAGSPLNDRALRQGFAVVTVALLHNTVNCNPIVQAEAAVMAKEHVAETYGAFDMVFGMGSSGGAISQIMDQNAYPGLYDGLILNHLFSDSDASRQAAYDCRLIADAWAKPGASAWTEAQKIAVSGMQSGCASSPTRFQIYNPSVGTNCTVPDADKFDAVKNPKGVRCTLQDYEVNQVGRRPDGYAFGRMDTTGVQYGLKALLAGTISPAQFTELNTAIGGHDINFKPQAARTSADVAGLARLYPTGVVNPQSNLADTPIIETRLSVTDFHQPFHAVMVRARLDRAQGHHDNYALWRTPNAREATFTDQSFDTMVAWIKAIQADTRNVSKAQKVRDNRPAMAKDRCVNNGADQALSACARPIELARALAGAPDTNDTGKCQLKPMRRTDYGKVSFTDDQWAALQKTFPTGVCDYAKPMVGFTKTTPWLAYSGDGKSKPLPPEPRSR